MDFRQIISNLRQNLPTILIAVAVVAGAVLAIRLLPNRTAAVILGVLAAVALVYLLFQGWQRTVQLAVFWFTAGVVADAAYAKLNDQLPVTVANLLVRLADSLVKLADVLIRSLGVGGPDVRGKMAAVAPDFAWALIVTAVVLMAINLAGQRRNNSNSARTEFRRAA
jgi:hypothetical protein